MSSDELQSAAAAAPPALGSWLRTQPSLDAAWESCDRADWLLWLARRRDLSDGRRRALVGAAALAIGLSDEPSVPRRTIRIADAWSRSDYEDQDPTGLSATLVALFVGGAVGMAVELWLYFRGNNPVRGFRRELISFPIFLALAFVVRLIARPLLRRRWVQTVRRYSFERAEAELFPHLSEAVDRTAQDRRAVTARVFRERLAWKSAQ